jgi:hypothetical protein
MRRLPAVILVLGCGDPDVVLHDVRIPVVMRNAAGPACPAPAFEAAASVSVELLQPLGPPNDPLGYCLLRSACVPIRARSVSDLDGLQQALHDEGLFFEDLPEFDDVQLFIRGTPYDDCQFSPAEDPLFCGLSGLANIADPEAQFTVAVSCQLECPSAPDCAGAE